MRPSVYIETTVPSYLTAWPSAELVTTANQQATRDWWDSARPKNDLFISQIVVDEAAAGDSEASARRIAAIEGLPQLDVSDKAESLAGGCWREQLYRRNARPTPFISLLPRSMEFITC